MENVSETMPADLYSSQHTVVVIYYIICSNKDEFMQRLHLFALSLVRPFRSQFVLFCPFMAVSREAHKAATDGR